MLTTGLKPNKFVAEVSWKEKISNNGSTVTQKTPLMKPADEDVLQRWPVSKRVNSSRAPDDDATLIEIEASVATADEILAANNFFARERV